jgi:hypothetical protein
MDIVSVEWMHVTSARLGNFTPMYPCTQMVWIGTIAKWLQYFPIENRICLTVRYASKISNGVPHDAHVLIYADIRER